MLNIGTFDVNNYGDLLFPKLAQKKLPDFYIQAISPTDNQPAGLNDCAPSQGIATLLGDTQHLNGAIIGGGNIIHCQSSKLEDYKLAKRTTFAYADLWIGASLLLPRQLPVVWNAPGVPNLFHKDQHDLVRLALQRARYLSVRDEGSRQYLLDVWPDADISVVPDSAWAIDQLWSQNDLQESYEALFTRLKIPQPDRTVIFHANERYLGTKSLSEVARKLDTIADYLSARPILIAFAPCHEDHKLSLGLARYMKTKPIALAQPHSLKEIAACVAFSEFYAGSSMHGLITASAFGVPAVAVAKRSMTKFEGLLNLTNLEDLVVENWDDAIKAAHTQNFAQRKEELGTLKKIIRDKLDIHWDHINQKLNNKINAQDENSRTPRLDLWNYHNELSQSSMSIQDDDFHLKLKEKSKIYEDQIKVLSANIQKLNSSFSWKLTKPLRQASSRFPQTGEKVISFLKKINQYARLLTSLKYTPRITYDWGLTSGILEKINAYKDATSKKNKRKIAVYSAVFGEYDTLLLPKHLNEDVDYICFTDRPRQTYGVWQIRTSPYYHPDPVRIARFIKTHPHQLLSDYDYVIWIDGNVSINCDIHKYIDMLRDEETGVGMIPHPLRENFTEEVEACKHLAKDDPKLIDTQASYYLENGIDKYAGLYETNVMVIRPKDQNVATLFTAWWREIEKFSRRDQLALAWTLTQHPMKVTHILPKGVSVREEKDFIYFTHKDSRNLKVPAEILGLGHLQSLQKGEVFTLVKETRLNNIKDTPIDVIVCVYNALEDVQICLNSAREHLLPSHTLIIINDRSDQPTTDFLRTFSANDAQVTLVENETNLGYTKSASLGLATGTADFRIMLNSDTIVSENWALKMLDVAQRRDDIGIVSPLSNAAGVQSVPEIKTSGAKGLHKAINVIPDGISNSDLDLFLETISPANIYPEVPLVHGFCYGVKKAVIEKIGYFDDVNFERYYGEENDYCMRATAAGFRFAIVTNTYVFHRKARSIAEEERMIHLDKSGKRLRELYGSDNIRIACLQGEDHPLLIDIRSKVKKFLQK